VSVSGCAHLFCGEDGARRPGGEAIQVFGLARASHESLGGLLHALDAS
jgi:hypothetical protein